MDFLKNTLNGFGKLYLDISRKQMFSYTKGKVTAMIVWVSFSVYFIPDLEMGDS